jgi:hypothetical protein
VARKLRRSTSRYEKVPIRGGLVSFPKVNYSVPNSSYWRVDVSKDKATAIITVTPDGIELGWDTCGICSMGFYGCQCKAGISLPNSIGYLYTTRGGVRPTPPPLAVTFTPPKPKRSLSRTKPEPVKPKRKLRRLNKVEETPAKKPRRLKRR